MKLSFFSFLFNNNYNRTQNDTSHLKLRAKQNESQKLLRHFNINLSHKTIVIAYVICGCYDAN